jgi:hypothetical protein
MFERTHRGSVDAEQPGTIFAGYDDTDHQRRWLMSLIENLARQAPSIGELVRDGKRLTAISRL